MNLAAQRELFGRAKKCRNVVAGSEAALREKSSSRSAGAEDGDIHKELLLLRD
jgi:hypothetical protein